MRTAREMKKSSKSLKKLKDIQLAGSSEQVFTAATPKK